MEKRTSGWTGPEIAELVGGTWYGPENLRVFRAVPAGTADPEGVTFAGSPGYLEKALSVPVGIVILNEECGPCSAPHVLVSDPKSAFARFLLKFDSSSEAEPGIHATAIISPSCQIDPTATIGPNVFIDEGTVVHERAQIHANCSIGPRCTIGKGTTLRPNVTLVQDVRLGEGCLVQSGAVLGSDGFGFAGEGESRVKIPQVGGVVVGDFVEIGSNTCIDRATMGDTIIGNRVKIDNLCQIGHNVRIGDHCVLTGMVGIGGSAVLGENVMVGANSGIKDNVTIAAGVKLGGRSGVTGDIKEPGEYWGFPAIPKSRAMRVMTYNTLLPDIVQRLKKLEKGGDSSS